MPATKKATTRPKRRIVSPAEERTQLRLTVDSKFTKSHFNQLFSVLKVRRKNALAEHIIMSFKTKAAQAQLVAFYNNQWLNIPFQSIDTAFVFPLTFEIADELERVGGEILGGVNRSKAFRVMVAYYAFVHKLKNDPARQRDRHRHLHPDGDRQLGRHRGDHRRPRLFERLLDRDASPGHCPWPRPGTARRPPSSSVCSIAGGVSLHCPWPPRHRSRPRQAANTITVTSTPPANATVTGTYTPTATASWATPW